MDKKKVKELIEQAIIWSRQANQYSVISNLEEALKELNKSDWVSVEDGLPDYEEDVLVCNENEPSDMWFGHRTSDRRVVVDEHEFAKGYGTITHWHKIDKLED
jgi:hypothetical protein